MANLRDQGILTEAEFQAQKSKLLGYVPDDSVWTVVLELGCHTSFVVTIKRMGSDLFAAIITLDDVS